MPGSLQWSFSFRFSHKNPAHACCLPHPSYMSRPSLSSRFYYPHNIRWWVYIMKLLIMKFSLLPCYLVPLRPKFSPQDPILKHPQPMFLPQCQQKTTGKIISLYILIFKYLNSKL
jgi:hypothetical protein